MGLGALPYLPYLSLLARPSGRFYFRVMKRPLPLSLAFLGCVLALPALAFAEDPVTTAAREEMAANYQSLSAKVTRLEEDLHSAQRQIQKLDAENYRLRDELERQKNRNENAATLEKISRLQEAIKQVDDARLDNHKKVLAQIERLGSSMEKALRSASAPPPERADPPPKKQDPPSGGPKSVPDVGREYTIKKGDTLLGLIAAAKEQLGVKLTQKQMEEANPGVNWSKLRIGQKIFIPTPAP